MHLKKGGDRAFAPFPPWTFLEPGIPRKLTEMIAGNAEHLHNNPRKPWRILIPCSNCVLGGFSGSEKFSILIAQNMQKYASSSWLCISIGNSPKYAFLCIRCILHEHSHPNDKPWYCSCRITISLSDEVTGTKYNKITSIPSTSYSSGFPRYFLWFSRKPYLALPPRVPEDLLWFARIAIPIEWGLACYH